MHTLALTEKWGLQGPLHIRPVKAGYMNLTHFIETRSNSYVLRVYQTQVDVDRIRFEHALTAWLPQAGLSFHVPAPLPSSSGDTLVRVPGAHGGEVLASLVPLIPGIAPQEGNVAHSHAVGAALGELDVALASLPEEVVRQARSTYRDLRTTHAAVPDLLAVIQRLPLPSDRRARMTKLTARLLHEAPLLYQRLPTQVIHGDCTNGNVLIENERVVGFLDFEFAGQDVRAMDLAVGLGGGPYGQRGPGATWEELEAFARGYASRQRLSEAELEAIPVLISLRRTAMLAHFAYRWQQGLETDSFIANAIIEWILDGEDWLQAVGAELVARLRDWFRSR